MKRMVPKARPKQEWMRRAIREAQRGMSHGEGGPFGACLVRDGKVLACAHNTVLKSNDPTQHAEVNAIRKASRKLKRFDLSGCTIVSTTEPCPMCFSAIHWARIDRLFYGTSFRDVQRRGFHEMAVPAVFLKKKGKSPVRIEGDFLKEECTQLLRQWDRLPRKRTY